MNELKIFENAEFGKVRAVDVNGEAWLVGKDVAEALGYSNASKAVMVHVDDEDKHFEMLAVADSQNGNVVTKTAVINESGLYSPVLGSKLPSAKKFKHWVTSEVLPSVRKHGAYMTPDTIEKLLLNPDSIIQMLTTLKEERAQRVALEEKVQKDAPKVLFADSVAASHSVLLVGELAKLLRQNGVEMGGKRLFAWMRDNGYLIRREGADYNTPTQYAMERGWFEPKETTITHADGRVTVNKTPKVTGKGQQYFLNLFLGKDGN